MAKTNDTTPDEAPDMSALDNIMGNLQSGTPAGPGIDSAFLSGIDLSKVSGGDTIVLTNGETYDFEITKATMGKSATDNTKLTLNLTVTDDYAEAGGMILDSVVFTEASLWKFKSLCIATGLLSPAGLFSGSSHNDFVGRSLRAKIKNDYWNNELRSKVDGGYKPIDSLEADGGISSEPSPHW